MDTERRSLVLLSILAFCVFLVTALILSRLLPGAETRLDYLVIGTVSAMFALATVFIAILRAPSR
jgi:hypothetical protein